MVPGPISGTFFDAPKTARVAFVLHTILKCCFSFFYDGINSRIITKKPLKKSERSNNLDPPKVEMGGIEPLDIVQNPGGN